jgi:predicted glycosyltransferase involved in capsule biosynthesis
MKFTYIIAYRNSTDRINNLSKILRWISNLDCEIIIVESDKSSFLKTVDLGVVYKHIFLENELPFNKSWCFNVGWKAALNDIIVFGDADLVMNQESLVSSIEKVSEYECINPYSSVVDLEYSETDKFWRSGDINDLYSISRPGRGETDHQKVPFCGGIIIFQKQALEKIYGWNEEFWGWGAEDDFQSIKVRNYLNHLQVKDKCYHLWHIRGNINQELYYRNLHLYNRYLNLSKEQLLELTKQTSNKIGDFDKIKNIT